MAGIPNQEEQKRLLQAAAAVDPAVRAFIASAAIDSQRVVENWPYYSRVRIQAEVTVGVGVVTYTLTAGQNVLAFSYAEGDEMLSAGFPAGRLATYADTNLSDRRKTKDGETLYIQGLSAHLVPQSEPLLANPVWGQSDLLVQRVGGDVVKKIGPLAFVPQSGGLWGQANTALAGPGAVQISNQVNGLPYKTNYWEFPEEIIWTPSGKTDGSFQLKLTVEQGFAFVATAGPGFVPPEEEGDLGTFVEILFLLHSTQRSRRSVNQ